MDTTFEKCKNTTDEWYTPKEIIDAFMAITIQISACGGKQLMKKQDVPTTITQH